MKTFYGVALLCFFVGMIIVCFYAPWTSTSGGSPGAHSSLGFAPVWSKQFLGVPGAHIDADPMGLLAAVVAFFFIPSGARHISSAAIAPAEKT